MKNIIKNNGFMMVEVLIAVSILTISVSSFIAVAEKSVYMALQSVHTAQAGFLLEEGAESVRILRDNAWSNISSLTDNINYYPLFSGGTWTLSSTANTVGIFTRIVNVASVKRNNATGDISSTGTDDNGTKLITVTVSWLEGGTTVTKTLSFYLADIFL
jgi:Tfp pilus assembly protein PilV